MVISIIAGISSGICEYIKKIILDQKYKPAVYTLLWAIVGTIVFLPFPLLDLISGRIPYTQTSSAIAWVLLAAAGLLFVMSNNLGFKALKSIDLSIYSIVVRISLIVSLLGGFFLLKEDITLKKIIGVSLILLGVIVVFAEKKAGFQLKKELFFALMSGIFGGIAVVLNKAVLQVIPVSVVVLMNYLMQVPFSSSKDNYISVVKIVKQKYFKVIIGLFLTLIAWGGYTYALNNNEVSVVLPVYQSLQFITQILLGILILKEKELIIRKIIGVVFNISGIILVCL